MNTKSFLMINCNNQLVRIECQAKQSAVVPAGAVRATVIAAVSGDGKLPKPLMTTVTRRGDSGNLFVVCGDVCANFTVVDNQTIHSVTSDSKWSSSFGVILEKYTDKTGKTRGFLVANNLGNSIRWVAMHELMKALKSGNQISFQNAIITYRSDAGTVVLRAYNGHELSTDSVDCLVNATVAEKPVAPVQQKPTVKEVKTVEKTVRIPSTGFAFNTLYVYKPQDMQKPLSDSDICKILGTALSGDFYFAPFLKSVEYYGGDAELELGRCCMNSADATSYAKMLISKGWLSDYIRVEAVRAIYHNVFKYQRTNPTKLVREANFPTILLEQLLLLYRLGYDDLGSIVDLWFKDEDAAQSYIDAYLSSVGVAPEYKNALETGITQIPALAADKNWGKEITPLDEMYDKQAFEGMKEYLVSNKGV